MKCIEKIYRKEGCARNSHFVCPKQYIVPKKKHNDSPPLGQIANIVIFIPSVCFSPNSLTPLAIGDIFFDCMFFRPYSLILILFLLFRMAK